VSAAPPRLRPVALLVALVALASVLWPAEGMADPVHRTCGILPGDGAYSYTKTQGIRCKPAIKISRRVTRRFCGRPGNCEFGPGTSIAGIYRGKVRYRDWDCRGQDRLGADCGRLPPRPAAHLPQVRRLGALGALYQR
jgi:hypothetical protein